MSTQWQQLSQPEQNRIIAEVKALMGSAQWTSWESVAKSYGLTSDTGMRARCDEKYAEIRRAYREREKKRRQKPQARPQRGWRHFEETYGPPSHHRGGDGPPREVIAARLAEIPEDTRTLAQQLCGDPIPGDKRRVRYG